MEREVSSPSTPAEKELHTPIQRVVSARLSEEARQRILADHIERFAHQERPEWKQYELPKSPQRLELIAFAGEATDKLIQRCGRGAFRIPPDNYHILNDEGRKKLKLRWESGGAYSIDNQAIFMRPETDPVTFGLVAYHETLHFKSYQALQRLYPGKEVVPYRRGLEIITRHGHRSYFRRLDEAVIQEMSNHFIREQLSEYTLTKDAVAASEARRDLILQHRNKLPRKDVQFLEELVPYVAELPDKARAIFSQSDPPAKQLSRAFDECKYRNTFVHAYADELRDLHSLVDEIYRRNRDQFESKEAVFNLFVEAVITGNILPVGRVIENTLGKGSFRRLGEGEEILPQQLKSQPGGPYRDVCSSPPRSGNLAGVFSFRQKAGQPRQG